MGIRSLRTASISTGVKRSKVWDQNTLLDYNDFDHIATITGTGNTMVASSIPSTYKNLRIYYVARTTAGSSDVDNTVLYFNSDTSGANYKGYYWGTGEGLSGIFPLRTTGSTSTSGYYAVGQIDILDYSTTNKFKQCHVYAPCVQPSNAEMFINYTTWLNTSAINTITWGYGAGNFVSGSALYIYGYN